MAAIDTTLLGHLPDGLRATAEQRIQEAAPHYMWFFTGEGKRRVKLGFCSACLESGIRADKEQAPPMKMTEDALKEERAALGLDGGIHPDLVYWKKSEHREEVRCNWRHGDFGVCPRCGALVEYRSANISRRYLADVVLLCRYDRSRADPDTLVMTLWRGVVGWCVWNPWTDRQPPVDVELMEVCLMRRGSAGERWTAEAKYDPDRKTWREVLTRRRECKSGYVPASAVFPYTHARDVWILDEQSLQTAISGLQIADTLAAFRGKYDAYTYWDEIDLINGILRWPCVEYLCKLGYTGLARNVIRHEAGRTLNLKGKTAQAVLRVNGDTWGWIKGKKIPLTLYLLDALHARDRLGLRLGNDCVLELTDRTLIDAQKFLREVARALPPGKAEKAVKYVLKRHVNFTFYLDHLDMMQQLDMDMSDDAMTMPADFQEIHGRLGQRMAAMANRAEDRKVQKRLEKLGMYWFSALGLTLRPLVSLAEVNAEGAALRHCVATYGQRYAAGGTVLLCLRRDEALTTPWHTVEFSTAGRMIQCRGDHNKTDPDDEPLIEAFWQQFEIHRRAYAQAHQERAPKGARQGKRGNAA